MCKKIEESISAHYLSLGLDPPLEQLTQEIPSSQTSESSANVKTKTSQSKRAYCPRPGTGGFAIMIALYKAEVDDNLTPISKSDLIERAQSFCSESMTAPKVGSHYTAFHTIKTLIGKDLVVKEERRAAFYSLTDTGRQLGFKLATYASGGVSQLSQASQSLVASTGDSDENNSEPVNALDNRFSLVAGSFEIVLIVDSREQTSGVSQYMRKTALIAELIKRGTNAEMRGLPVGDFAWVARKTASMGNSNLLRSQELILDIVMERKRVDDLEGSIKDGRWQEQKYRLKNSGVRQPTYLIEGLDPNKNYYGIPYRNLHQAVKNSQVIDGFNVKFTSDYEETVSLLVTMTKYLQKTMTKKTLVSCTHDELLNEVALPRDRLMKFSEFSQHSQKVVSFTVTEMFLKQLLQIKGVSLAKAKAITEIYKTFHDLNSAYDECSSQKEKEVLLAQVKFGERSANIGPAISKLIYNYYSGIAFEHIN